MHKRWVAHSGCSGQPNEPGSCSLSVRCRQPERLVQAVHTIARGRCFSGRLHGGWRGASAAAGQPPERCAAAKVRLTCWQAELSLQCGRLRGRIEHGTAAVGGSGGRSANTNGAGGSAVRTHMTCGATLICVKHHGESMPNA